MLWVLFWFSTSFIVRLSMSSKILNLNICFYWCLPFLNILFVHLWEKESTSSGRGNDRGRSRLPIKVGSLMKIPEPGDHVLSQRQTVYHPSNPGTTFTSSWPVLHFSFQIVACYSWGNETFMNTIPKYLTFHLQLSICSLHAAGS